MELKRTRECEEKINAHEGQLGKSKYQTRKYRLLVKAVKRKKRGQGGGRDKKKDMAYAFYPCFHCAFFTAILSASLPS